VIQNLKNSLIYTLKQFFISNRNREQPA